MVGPHSNKFRREASPPEEDWHGDATAMPLREKVLVEMTNGGVDRAVERTGHIYAMIAAFECVHDGWGVAVLVGVPHKEAVFKTHPMNFLNGRTLKGIFFGNYKPCTDLPEVVEMYMTKELELLVEMYMRKELELEKFMSPLIRHVSRFKIWSWKSYRLTRNYRAACL